MFSFDIIFLRQLDTILLESKLYWWYCKDLMLQHYSMEISLILELMNLPWNIISYYWLFTLASAEREYILPCKKPISQN